MSDTRFAISRLSSFLHTALSTTAHHSFHSRYLMTVVARLDYRIALLTQSNNPTCSMTLQQCHNLDLVLTAIMLMH